MDDTTKIKTQIRKGLLDFVVLATLKKESRYPREIIGQLEADGLDVVEGTLYPLFLRLARQDLVTYIWKETTGHPRKYYSLTLRGLQLLKIYESEWRSISITIKNLIDKK